MRLKKWLIALLTAAMSVTTLVAVTACKPAEEEQQPIQEGPETGVYYYDVSLSEDVYKIALNNGNQFTFLVMGENKTGTYTLSGETLTLDFARDEDGEIAATLSDDVLSLTYNSSSMRFLKEIDYTVTFDSQGGSAVDPVTVVNGRSIARPADPGLDGSIFVGWYTDAAHTVPFAFGAQPVTSDMTLYAYWIARTPGSSEYTVDFDLGVEAGEGAEAPASVTTIGGCVIAEDLPVPELDGYVFLGWYVSAFDDAAKLTYEYTAGTPLSENTTLYALWAQEGAEGLAAPEVSVAADGVSWNRVTGANSYAVTIATAEGVTVASSQLNGTVTSYDFDFLASENASGEYVVTVSASSRASVSSDDDSVVSATRYYNNRALSRVSVFRVVEPSGLIFEGVPNAERYYLTIVCGDERHNHSRIALGSLTNYNFASCPMAEGGIRFTVTAEADGWISSVSEEFVYDRALAQVSGFTFDEETETVSWEPVPDAMSYVVVVSVSSGDSSHVHSQIDIGNRTSYCLKEYAPMQGGIVFSVYPRTKGYNSPVASTYTYQKTTPATPGNIRVSGTELVWDSVGTDISYTVRINGSDYSAAENTFDLSGIVTAGSDFSVSVRADGDGVHSLWSDAQTLRLLEMTGKLTYSGGVLSWNPVVGATYYEVQVNNGEPVRIENGDVSADVRLTQAGNNTLSVRFGDDTAVYDGLTTTVYAYEIAFDARGGSAVESLYVAYGDPVELPAMERPGYVFGDWYTVPGGAGVNGAQYTDTTFAEGGNIVLYAYWIPVPSTVTFVADGGSLTSETDSVVYGDDYQFEVPGFTDDRDERYVFLGWYSQASGGVQYTDGEGNSVAPWAHLDDVTLYAHWLHAYDFVQTVGDTGSTIYAVQAGPNFGQLVEARIPATYRGVTVARIYSGAFSSARLQSLDIPDCMEMIGSVSTSDAMGVFANCTSLMNVNIYQTEGDHDVYYSSVGGVLLYDNPQTDLVRIVYFPAARSGSYRVPDGVQEIPLRTFAGSDITSVTIPASVRYIRSAAFYGSSVQNVYFEAPADSSAAESLTIEDLAFQNCTDLKEITLPLRLAEFDPDEVFAGCTQFANIAVEEGHSLYSSYQGLLCSAPNATIGGTQYTQTTVLYCPIGRMGEVTIPSQVAAIGANAFEGRSGLTGVVIHGYLTSVGDYAFAECSRLGKVEFLTNAGVASDVTIGNYAFYNCTMLSDVSLSENITKIGESAFAYCELVLSLTIPGSVETIGINAFQSCVRLEKVVFNGSEIEISVGEGAFLDCTQLTSVELSATVTSFDAVDVLAGCDLLESITVDPANQVYEDYNGILYTKGLTKILYYPKYGPEDVTFAAAMTTIGERVFADNTTIKSVTIGTGVTMIEPHAFDRCILLETVEFLPGEGEALTIGEAAFADCTLIETLVLPDRVSVIGANAFNHNASLGTVTFGTEEELAGNCSLTSIGAGAFAGTAIEEISLPANLKTLAATAEGDTEESESIVGAFDSCEQLIRVEFSAALETVDGAAFSNCTNLSEIVIPSGVVNIADNSFRDFAALSEITIEGNTLVSIGDYAFAGCSPATITIPASVKEIGDSAFADCGLKELLFGEGTVSGLAIGNNAFSGNNLGQDAMTVTLPEGIVSIGDEAFAAGEDAALSAIVVPASVQSIGDRAFYNYKTVNSITFSSAEGAAESMTIGDEAFANSSVSAVELPANLNALGENVFSGCMSFTTVSIPAENLVYASSDGVLYNYDKTQIVLVPAGRTTSLTILGTVTQIGANVFNGSSLTSVTLEEGITSIGESAFEGSKLVSVTIPASVTTIGKRAFADCEALASVTFTAAGEEQAEQLTSISESMFAGSGLVSITIPASVTTIETSAFEGCASLKTVDFAEGSQLATIGAGAFRESSVAGSAGADGAVVPLELPENVVTIGEYAFYACKSLTGVTFAGSALKTVQQYAFSESGLASIVMPAATSLVLGNNVFDSCASLKTADFTKIVSFAALGNYLFAESGLTSFTVPNIQSAFKLGAYTFQNCEDLTSVTLESNYLIEIGNYVFAGSGLQSVTIPASVTSIGQYTFRDCADLKSVTFEGNNLTKIGNYVFAGSGIQSVTIPASVTSIGDYAFAESGLQSVTIPANVTSIGKYTFRDCADLKSVTFAPDSKLSTVAQGAFYASGLEEITIPASVTDLGGTANAQVFYQCKSLKTVGFEPGSKLTEFRNQLFGQSGLERITIPSGVTKIGNSFSGATSLEYVYIPNTVKEIGSTSFNKLTKLSTVIFEEGGTEALTIANGTTRFSSSQLNSLASGSYNMGAFIGCTALETIELPARLTSIGHFAFALCEKLKSVTFEEGSKLTTIGAAAFYGCAFENFTIPAGVTSIANGPNSTYDDYLGIFRECKALTTLTLPDNWTFDVVDLGIRDIDGAFTTLNVTANNTRYTAIDGVLFSDAGKTLAYFPTAKDKGATYTIPSGTTKIGNDAFYRTTGSTSYGGDPADYAQITGVVIPEGVTDIGNNAFRNILLTSVDLPSTLQTLGNGAFYGTDLTSVMIPASVTTLGSDVFKEAESLAKVKFEEGSALNSIGAGTFESTAIEEIELPDSVTTLGNNVFRDCASLERAKLPSGLTTVPNWTFGRCSALKSVTFPDNVTSFGMSAFSYSGLQTFEIPASVQSIGNSCFSNATSLVSVTTEEGSVLTTLGTGVFQKCLALQSVELPASVSAIPNNTFNGCVSLLSFTVPQEAASIGNNAFDGCSALESVHISGNVSSIGNYAFRNCTELSLVDILPGLQTIGQNAFDGCSSLTALVLPNTLTAIGANAFANASVQLTVADGSVTYALDEYGALYDSRMTTLISFPTNYDGAYVIPDTVISIPEGVFRGSKITSITIGSRITEISEYMFAETKSLKEVIFRGRITTIGAHAFENSAIESITIGRYVTTIDDYAFAGCTALKTLTFEANGGDSLQLGDYAFQGCTQLASVQIPSRVRNLIVFPEYTSSSSSVYTGIGSYCFEGCTSLTSVTFEQAGGWLMTEGLSLGAYAFSKTAISTFVFPDYIEYVIPYNQAGMIGNYATYTPQIGEGCFKDCTALETVQFPESYPEEYSNDEFYILSYAFAGCTSLGGETGVFSLPENFRGNYYMGGTWLRASNMFQDCTNLKEVTFNVVDYAGSSSDLIWFTGCTNLETVNIVGTADGNGDGAWISGSMFEGLTSLKTVNIIGKIDTIYSDAFKGCTGLTEITLPDTVQYIYAGAFAGCTGLTEIAIPESVERIYAGAFEGWTEEQTIVVPFAEGQLPEDWEEGWSGNATVQYASASSEEGAE